MKYFVNDTLVCADSAVDAVKKVKALDEKKRLMDATAEELAKSIIKILGKEVSKDDLSKMLQPGWLNNVIFELKKLGVTITDERR